MKNIVALILVNFICAFPTYSNNRIAHDRTADVQMLYNDSIYDEDTNNSYDGFTEYSPFEILAKPISDRWTNESAEVNTQSAEYFGVDKTCIPNKDVTSASVDDNGNFIFSIPLQVVTNHRGPTPNLNIVYNSALADGVFGTGWTITGLSEITIVSQNQYYDGAFDNSTAYMIDGKRMVLKRSNGNQKEYYVDNRYDKIIGFCSNEKVNYFYVYYRDGSTARYDVGENSYYITNMSDRYGQMVKFLYTDKVNYKQISSIVYNNEKQRIDFKYKSLGKYTKTLYHKGLSMKIDQILSSIISGNNGNDTYVYNIDYKNIEDKLVVSKIEYLKNGKRFNAYSCEYGMNVGGKSFSAMTQEFTGISRPLNADENFFMPFSPYQGNNGNSILIYPKKNAYASKELVGYDLVDEYTGDEEFYVISPQYYTQERVYLRTGQPLGKGFVRFVSADINGDGGEEIIKINDNNTGVSDSISFRGYFLTANNKLSSRVYEPVQIPLHNGNLQPKTFLSGDFDGDGRKEILCALGNNQLDHSWTDSHFYIFNLANNTQKELKGRFNYQLIPLMKEPRNPDDVLNSMFLTNGLYAADIDGDGRDELLKIAKTSEVSVYKIKEDSLCLLGKNKYDVHININEHVADRLYYLGDFNGDGKTDIIWTAKLDEPEKRNYPVSKKREAWYLGLSKGDGTFDIKTVTTYLTHWYETFFITDVNHDGISDIVGYDSDENTFVVRVLHHNSSDEHPDEEYSADIVGVELQNGESLLLPYCGGINSASMIAIGDKKITTISYGQNINKDIKLSHLWKNDGTNIYPYYKFQVSPRNHYVQYPYGNQRNGRWIVSKLVQGNAGKTFLSNSYMFKSPVLRVDGLGFVGYDEVSVIDNIRKSCVTKKFDTKNFGVLKSVVSPLEAVEYDYDIATNQLKWTSIKLKSTLATDSLTNNKTTTTYRYDEYGNVANINKAYEGGVSNVVSMEYTDDSPNISLLKRKEERTDRDGFTYSQTVEYDYDKKLHNNKIRTYLNDYLYQTELYTYTDNKVTGKASWFQDSQNLDLETWNYDENGLLVSSTDKDALETRFSYNNFDRISSEANHKNLGTSYVYDSAGSLVGKKLSDGTSEMTEFGYSDDYANAVYKKVIRITGKPVQVEYYDGLHRVVRKGVQDIDGRYIYIDYTYDDKGNLVAESIPSKNDGQQQIKYVYDKYGRLVLKEGILPGDYIAYSYLGNKRNVEKTGISYEEEYDAMGNLISTDSKNKSVGSVSYEYYPNGKVRTITDHDGKEWFFAYDEFDRIVFKHDPCAGNTVYNYNKDGDLEMVIDNADNSTMYTYDTRHRMTSKKSRDVTTKYEYTSDGKLSFVDNSTGCGKSIVYDIYNRPTEIVIKSDGGYQRKKIGYDKNGQVEKIVYTMPNDSVVEHLTYENGILRQISTNHDKKDKPSFRLVETDHRGNATKVSVGPLIKSFVYGEGNRCTNIKTTMNGKTLQDISYKYNGPNLMEKMTDNLNGVSERYDYDELLRLNRYENNFIEYQPNGNISYMPGTGKLFYSENAENKYAVAGIEVEKGSYPVNDYDLEFNSQNRLKSLASGNDKVMFLYDGNGNRISSFSSVASEITEKFYISDNYELKNTVDGKSGFFYVDGTPYTANSVLKMTGDSISQYFIMRDVMGSITKIVDNYGRVVQDVVYDAWGNIRNPKTLGLADANTPLFLDRGFTGHEHLPMLGFINMNSRVYNPRLGRFISPDPVLNSENGQTLNPYTYANNNPLMFTDPDGRISTLGALGIFTSFSYLKGVHDNHNLNPLKWQSGFIMATVGFEGILSGDSYGCYGYASTPFGSFGGGMYYNEMQQPNQYVLYQTNGGYDYGMDKCQKNISNEYRMACMLGNTYTLWNEFDNSLSRVSDLGENKGFNYIIRQGKICSLIENNEGAYNVIEDITSFVSSKNFTKLMQYNRIMGSIQNFYIVNDAFREDGGRIGYNTQKSVANIVVDHYVSYYAALEGAKFFGTLGFYFWGPYGAIVGAAVGGVGMAILGEKASQYIVDGSFNIIYGH